MKKKNIRSQCFKYLNLFMWPPVLNKIWIKSPVLSDLRYPEYIHISLFIAATCHMWSLSGVPEGDPLIQVWLQKTTDSGVPEGDPLIQVWLQQTTDSGVPEGDPLIQVWLQQTTDSHYGS